MTTTLDRAGPGTVALGLLVAAAFLLPILFLVSLSFKSPDDVLSGAFLPSDPTLANWPGAFRTAALSTFAVNSLVVATLSGAITMAVTLPAAFAMTRLGVGEGWLPQITLASYIAPPVVALIPLFFLLRWTGLLGTLPGLALVHGLVNVPIAFWLMAPFLRRVPREVLEAAALDGAGPWTTLLRVVVPMIAPGLVATALIAMILSYNEFLFASTFAFRDEARTLTVGISLFQGERLQNLGQMAAASIAGVLPVYVIALLAQRWLIEGLTTGSVK